MEHHNQTYPAVRRLLKIAAPLALLGLYAFTAVPPQLHRIHVRILDAETGRPVGARLHFLGPDSTYYPPVGYPSEVSFVNYVEESLACNAFINQSIPFAYVGGEFDIDLPPGPIAVRVMKGFEYEIHTGTIQIDPGQRSLDIPLKRWITVGDGRWYSGDPHTHWLNPGSARLQTEAEDCNIVNILTCDLTADQHRFRGTPDSVSSAEWIVSVNQEYRTWLGHLTLLNLRQLVQPVFRETPIRHPVNADVADKVREQGGIVLTAHFGGSPGIEMPVDAALGKLDAVEVMCTTDPFRHLKNPSGAFSVPQRGATSVLDIWYKLLNCGFRIPGAAATDRMGNQVTVGSNRTYVHIPGGLSYQGWIDGLRAGRSFWTNAPILLLTVDGRQPGDEITRTPGDTSPLKIRAEVASQLPVHELEIIVNGESVAATEVADRRRAVLEWEYVPDGAAWIAARAYADPIAEEIAGTNFYQRYMPPVITRGTAHTALFGTLDPEVPFAHTNPVYVQAGTRPNRSPRDARYFIDWIDRALRQVTVQRFATEQHHAAAVDAFTRAREVFAARAVPLETPSGQPKQGREQ